MQKDFKKIIKGKLYDTETALMCGGVTGFYRGEYLYRKHNGEFFLYTVGIAESEKIVPLTEEQAKEWVENNLSVDKYIAIFGEVQE